MCCHDRRHWDFGRGPDWHHHEHRDPHHHRWGPDCWPKDFWPFRFGPFGFRRYFISNREVLEALERYLEELEKEAQGVREAIAEIKAEMEGQGG